jgi:hypothetical protein
MPTLSTQSAKSGIHGGTGWPSGFDPSRPLSLMLGMALLPHLESLFQASAWYDGSTSTAMVKEI